MQNQLKQLERLNPAAYDTAVKLIDSGKMGSTQRVVRVSMLEALTEHNSPVVAIWRAIEAAARSGNVPVVTGPTIRIGKLWGQAVSLFRLPDGAICVTAKYRGLSAPVIRWGRDWKTQNSAYSGTWKLAPGGRKNLEDWINQNESDI